TTSNRCDPLAEEARVVVMRAPRSMRVRRRRARRSPSPRSLPDAEPREDLLEQVLGHALAGHLSDRREGFAQLERDTFAGLAAAARERGAGPAQCFDVPRVGHRSAGWCVTARESGDRAAQRRETRAGLCGARNEAVLGAIELGRDLARLDARR